MNRYDKFWHFNIFKFEIAKELIIREGEKRNTIRGFRANFTSVFLGDFLLSVKEIKISN